MPASPRHRGARFLLGVAALSAAVACNRLSSESPDSGDSEPAPPAAATVSLPMEATPVSQLSNAQLRHTELLRITRNFGKEHFQIALDAWVAADKPGEIADVRLWWARTDRNDERSPFGPNTRKHFEIDYERVDADNWRVHLVSDRKVFTFDIALGKDETISAYASVVASSGRRIEQCLAQSGELEARRFLGMPTGIRRLEVTCVDPEGTVEQARLVWTRPDSGSP